MEWLKQKWEAVKKWWNTKGSHVLWYARAQVVAGIGILAEHFSHIPWEQIADGTWNMTVQAWIAVGVLINGLVLEPLRKFKDEEFK